MLHSFVTYFVRVMHKSLQYIERPPTLTTSTEDIKLRYYQDCCISELKYPIFMTYYWFQILTQSQ